MIIGEIDICEYVKTFANRQVEDFDPQTGISDPVATAYALRVGFLEEENITHKLNRLLQDTQVAQIEALVFGMWNGRVSFYGDSSILVNALVEASYQLSSLKALFIGDILFYDSNMALMKQSNISPILEAYPSLEVLQVRGGSGLEFTPVRHNQLKKLIIQTNGLSSKTINQIWALHLPALEHLELWLGIDDYGGDSNVDTLRPVLDDIDLFPKLNYLGLRNSEYSEEIAKAIVQASIIKQIKVLDLSVGSIGDKDCPVLLSSPAVNQLQTLNVSDNFLSEAMINQLNQLNIEVIAEDQKEEYERDRRYWPAEE
ncbi:MAG: HEAT repeat domain-containing protein [Symploca sp. SIO3E6]|nr:HEAT repeat domain-containing protein [Caldora sp. SIO3E6]